MAYYSSYQQPTQVARIGADSPSEASHLLQNPSPSSPHHQYANVGNQGQSYQWPGPHGGQYSGVQYGGHEQNYASPPPPAYTPHDLHPHEHDAHPSGSSSRPVAGVGPHRHSPPAFWFIFAGMIHFLRHTHLWPPFLTRLPKLLILSVFVLTFLFVFTYIPHVALLFFFHGPLAWINAAFMVLNEAAMIITFIAENFMVEAGLVDVFDAVLLDHGLASLVSTAREIHPVAPSSVKALGKYTKSPYLRFSLSLTIKFILTLPLNFVPIVGPFLYIIAQGYLSGPLAHYRYFQLRHFTRKQERQWTREKVWAYLGFGVTHVTFQLFPVLSLFFLFTTACGAGLWTVEIERREGLLRQPGQGAHGREEEQRLCHRF